MYSNVHPTPVENPRLTNFSESCMKLLGIPVDELNDGDKRKEYGELLSGNRLFDGGSYLSHNYCGH